MSRQEVIIGSEGKVQTRWLDLPYGAIGWKAALVESWGSLLDVLGLLRSIMCTILLVSFEIGLDDELILIREVVLKVFLVHQVSPLLSWVVSLSRFHDNRSNGRLDSWWLRHQTLRALFVKIL